MHNPLSYIHLQRLSLSRAMDTPRQRAAVNEMLVGGLPRFTEGGNVGGATRQLLTYWRLWPEVCTMVGAHLLRQELSWRGHFLQLPASARFFMSLPLHADAVESRDRRGYRQTYKPSCVDSFNMQRQVQGRGLLEILGWQCNLPVALKSRLRLLFSPELDDCFEHTEPNSISPDLFLISQAIQYAKNYADHV